MSFIKHYAEFVKENEAHPTYHLFSGLVALSSIVSRRVWIEQGYFDVFPNLYVTLVGPPGNRKTTAMSVCKKLLRELGADLVPMSAECQTKESVVKQMAENERSFTTDVSAEPTLYTPLTVCVTELSHFLGANSAHMVDFLTNVYDEPVYENRTKNKGTEVIIGPYLTLLGCTTPAWITARMRDDVITGGFSRRCLFVYETGKGKRVARPEITKEMYASWKELVKISHKLLAVKGKFKWTPDALAFYDHWYETLDIPSNDLTASFYESKHIQLLKISMLIAVSETGVLVLDTPHLKMGLEMLQLVEDNLEKVFQGIGRNELNALASKAVEILDRAPNNMLPEKFMKKELFPHGNMAEILQVMLHLEQTDKIKKVQIGGEDGDPTATKRSFYKLIGKDGK